MQILTLTPPDKKQALKSANGHADDSGQSSSPDTTSHSGSSSSASSTTSSGNESIADSLEDQSRPVVHKRSDEEAAVSVANEQADQAAESKQDTTIRKVATVLESQTQANLNETENEPKRAQVAGPEVATDDQAPPASVLEPARGETPTITMTVATNDSPKGELQELTSRDTDNGSPVAPTNDDHDDIQNDKQPLKSALINNNNNNNYVEPTAEIPSKQQSPQKGSQQASNKSNPNSNYSGLNLNMTASEMRDLLASRKKFDPKKAQMNLRQKYEIIQQM